MLRAGIHSLTRSPCSVDPSGNSVGSCGGNGKLSFAYSPFEARCSRAIVVDCILADPLTAIIVTGAQCNVPEYDSYGFSLGTMTFENSVCASK